MTYVLLFSQSWQSLSASTGYEDLSKVTLAPIHTFDNAKKAIAELKAQLEDISKEELGKISSAGEQTSNNKECSLLTIDRLYYWIWFSFTVKAVQILQTGEPLKREEFLESKLFQYVATTNKTLKYQKPFPPSMTDLKAQTCLKFKSEIKLALQVA